MKYTLFTFFVAVFLFTAPSLAAAFSPNDQVAVRLTDDVVMYALTYELGYAKYEVMTPVVAIRSGEVESGYTEFTILDQSETVSEIGIANGIVLSTAPIVDGMYQVAQGESATFTLFALLTLPEVIDENLDLSLQISQLPFILSNKDTELDRGLNDSELQYYLTDEVDVDMR